MYSKIFISQFVYVIILVSYYFFIKMLNGGMNGGAFDVILFDYWSHGIVLYMIFLLVNLYFLFTNSAMYLTDNLYPILFFWLPYILFLIIMALVFFYAFISIGAPFQQNVFLNLLIVHAISFVIIKIILKIR